MHPHYAVRVGWHKTVHAVQLKRDITTRYRKPLHVTIKPRTPFLKTRVCAQIIGQRTVIGQRRALLTQSLTVLLQSKSSIKLGSRAAPIRRASIGHLERSAKVETHREAATIECGSKQLQLPDSVASYSLNHRLDNASIMPALTIVSSGGTS